MAAPKGSGLPLQELIAAMKGAGDYMTVIHLRAVTEILSDAYDNKEISLFEAAIADIDQYMDALQQNHITADEVNKIVQENSSKGCVLIPLEYLEVIVEGWRKYCARSGEISLGEAYKIEGGGQGKRKRLGTLKRLMRDVRLCDRVEFALARAELLGKPISREAAFGLVAEATSQAEEVVTAETVKRAYRRRGSKVRSAIVSSLI